MGNNEDQGLSYFKENQEVVGGEERAPYALPYPGDALPSQYSLRQSGSNVNKQSQFVGSKVSDHAQVVHGTSCGSCRVDGETYKVANTIKVPFVTSAGANGSKGCDLGVQASALRDKRSQRDVKKADQFKTTVLHMDFRRLSRRFNGVRQKTPHKRITLIVLYCLILEAWDILYTERIDGWWRFGIEVRLTTVEPWVPILVVNRCHATC